MQTTIVRTTRTIHPLAALIGAPALAMCLLVTTTRVQAHTFCITNANATQLQDALTNSSDGGIYNGEDNFIQIAQGTYLTGAPTGNGPFFYYSTTSTHLLFIEGGYNANCTSQIHKAALTTLDGRNMTGVLALRSANGTIIVDNLTLQKGESGEPGAGLQVNYLVSVNARVTIANNIIRNNHSSVGAGGVYASGAGFELYMSNNLIAGNSSDGQNGAGYVTGYGQYTYLLNNTVVKNTSTAVTNPSGGLYCGGTTPCGIYNNIFWNNTNYGIFLGNSGAILSHNDYGSQGGAAPAVDDTNLSTPPKFVDENNSDFHLTGDSPLLGFGFPQGTLIDLDGHDGPGSGKADLGAYFETIFINGFDGG